MSPPFNSTLSLRVSVVIEIDPASSLGAVSILDAETAAAVGVESVRVTGAGTDGVSGRSLAITEVASVFVTLSMAGG